MQDVLDFAFGEGSEVQRLDYAKLDNFLYGDLTTHTTNPIRETQDIDPKTCDDESKDQTTSRISEGITCIQWCQVGLQTNRTNTTRPCSCSFVKKYMCSRTVHEHLSNEILYSCSFVMEMNLFVFVC
ncbi:hypothetical protein HanPI659440_Chr11g0413261 [Helianthus annuus]|nr:hypothetical protein HanPI659440_Chr11g0413261 [Helianthus annuus]